MMKLFITLGAIFGLLLVSFPAAADTKTVAVLRPSYEIFREGTEDQEGDEAVFTMVKHAVKEAKMNVADQAATDAALQGLSGSTAAHCDNQSCLKMIAKSTGAWNAVAVTVVDKEAHFILSIKYAVGEELQAKVFGNRASLLDDIFGNVEKVLSSNAPEDATVPTDTENSSVDNGPNGAVDESEDSNQAQKDGLKPTAFYASAIITAALAIGWGTVEAIGYSKSKSLEGSEDSTSFESDRDKLVTLHAVDGVLLGAAVTAAITTTVLFFFTDFDGNKVKENKPSITTSLLEDGAIMGIKGTF